MQCDIARERLQDQIDGTLDPVVGRELDAHLDACAPCRALAADLAAVADAGASLDPIDVPEHVWLQLAGRWRREQAASGVVPRATMPVRAPRRYTSFHALAAAAMLAVAAGGGWIAWRATEASGDVILSKPVGAAGNADTGVLVESARNDLAAAEQLYTRAIAGLEQAAQGQKELLEPQVAANIDATLRVVDQAIGESRAAVKAQPLSTEARESLFEALRKKVALLQNTISLVSEISRGNQAGASRLSGT